MPHKPFALLKLRDLCGAKSSACNVGLIQHAPLHEEEHHAPCHKEEDEKTRHTDQCAYGNGT
jgi:hypothetical protein